MNGKEQSGKDNLSYLRFSGDFKNRAGPKAAVFFFAEDIIWFFILLPSVLLTLFLQKAPPAAYLSSPLLPAGLLLFTLCRLKPGRLWKNILFTVASTAALTAVFLAAKNYAAAVVTVFAALRSLIRTGRNFSALYEMTSRRGGRLSYRKRAPEERDREDEISGPVYLGMKTLVFAGILNCAVYLTALFFGSTKLALFCTLDFAAVFALMAVYGQKSGAYCLAQWDRLSKTENTPDGKKAEKSGSALLTFLTTVSAAAVTLIPFLTAVLSGDFRADNAFLQYLTRAFNAKPTRQKTAIPPNPVKSEPLNPFSQLPKSPPDTSPLAGIIRNVLTAVLWCVVLLAAVFVVIAVGSAVIKFYRKLGLNVNEESKSLFPAKKAGDKIRAPFAPRKKRSGFFSRDGNRSAIRRLFYTRILRMTKRQGKAVKKSDTPFELGSGLSGGSDLEKAAELYEKARYSNDACEDSDVSTMKLALKTDRRAGKRKRRQRNR